MALLSTIWGLAVLQAKSVMIGSVFCGVILFMTAVLLWGARADDISAPLGNHMFFLG